MEASYTFTATDKSSGIAYSVGAGGEELECHRMVKGMMVVKPMVVILPLQFLVEL